MTPEHARSVLRSKGLCGEPDGSNTRVCILLAGHADTRRTEIDECGVTLELGCGGTLELPAPIADPGLGDTMAETPDALHGAWICGTSLDDEGFSIGNDYETREDAIAGAADDLGQAKGDFFQTGQLWFVRHVPPFPTDALGLIEQVGEALYDDWGEDQIENWNAKVMTVAAEELEAQLEAVWNAWIEKHQLIVEGYTCEHIETHEVTTDEEDDTP